MRRRQLAGGRDIAIAELIRSIVYASSLGDSIFGDLLSHYSLCTDENVKTKALVLSGSKGAGSEWPEVEPGHYKALRDIGWTVDIRQTLPLNPLASYVAILTDWEAQSDLLSWNGTHLDDGVRRVRASEIMADWRLAS